MKISLTILGEGGLSASPLDHPKWGGLLQTHFFKRVVEVPNPDMIEEQVRSNSTRTERPTSLIGREIWLIEIYPPRT